MLNTKKEKIVPLTFPCLFGVQYYYNRKQKTSMLKTSLEARKKHFFKKKT